MPTSLQRATLGQPRGLGRAPVSTLRTPLNGMRVVPVVGRVQGSLVPRPLQAPLHGRRPVATVRASQHVDTPTAKVRLQARISACVFWVAGAKMRHVRLCAYRRMVRFRLLLQAPSMLASLPTWAKRLTGVRA